MQLVDAEIDVPSLVSEPAEKFEIRQIIDPPPVELQGFPANGVVIIAVLVDPVTRQQAQDRRF